MKSLIHEWQRYLNKDAVEEHMIRFCQATPQDKECMIEETFGIFDGKLQGDVFTYYYYCCDTVSQRNYGTENWWKGTDFRRVDYNIMTDEATVTPIKKRTKQIVEMASENGYRSLQEVL